MCFLSAAAEKHHHRSLSSSEMMVVIFDHHLRLTHAARLVLSVRAPYLWMRFISLGRAALMGQLVKQGKVLSECWDSRYLFPNDESLFPPGPVRREVEQWMESEGAGLESPETGGKLDPGYVGFRDALEGLQRGVLPVEGVSVTPLKGIQSRKRAMGDVTSEPKRSKNRRSTGPPAKVGTENGVDAATGDATPDPNRSRNRRSTGPSVKVGKGTGVTTVDVATGDATPEPNRSKSRRSTGSSAKDEKEIDGATVGMLFGGAGQESVSDGKRGTSAVTISGGAGGTAGEVGHTSKGSGVGDRSSLTSVSGKTVPPLRRKLDPGWLVNPQPLGSGVYSIRRGMCFCFLFSGGGGS